MSDWTPDTLKDHLDERIDSVERLARSELLRLEAVVEGQQRALELLGGANQIAQDKFEASVALRFVQVNEFRGALDDLGKTMATRREMEALTHVVTELRSRVDVGPSELRGLQGRLDVAAGEQQGSSVTRQLQERQRSFAIAVAGLAVAVAVFWTNSHPPTVPTVVTPTVTVPAVTK